MAEPRTSGLPPAMALLKPIVSDNGTGYSKIGYAFALGRSKTLRADRMCLQLCRKWRAVFVRFVY